MNILHIITGLRCGGAENTLKNLLSLHHSWASQTVATLDGRRTPLAGECERAGARVVSFRSIRGLWSTLRGMRPELIQAWMYHGNLAGAVLGSIIRTPVLWNLRRGALVSADSLQLKAVSRACAALSSSAPAAVVCCSEAAMQSHVAAGYCAARMTVIPNGVDSNRFHPSLDLRRSLRRDLGLADAAFVIGHVGRFSPVKDHATLVAAFAQLADRRPNAALLLCGQDVTERNAQLTACLRGHNLNGNVRLLGLRADVERVLPAFDVLACSSLTEGFSNVVVEAMSAGVPVIATDVGENRAVIGDTGLVVEQECPGQLADAAIALFDLGRDARLALGARARQRVTNEYDLASMGRRYRDLYESCARKTPVRSRDRQGADTLPQKEI
ncbi:MAG TPA: glycosyltransferase [Bryobacteraceae bacterium]|nr:glycosyltransferase [Bryobacteraceae bacterium]